MRNSRAASLLSLRSRLAVYGRAFARRYCLLAFAAGLFGLTATSVMGQGMGSSTSTPTAIPMTADRWTITAGKVEFRDADGKQAIDLKAGNYAEHIKTGVAVLKDFSFRNGTIEYDVLATSSMGAGFIFRRGDEKNYEMFYLRPSAKCDQAPDCVQYAPETHGVLLWDVFPQYQGPAPLHEGWNHIKLVVSGKRMLIYVNGAENNAGEPTLKIGRLEGDTEEGGLMLNGPGVFANLKVTPDAVAGLSGDAEPDATGSDDRYVRHWSLSPYAKLEAEQAPVLADMPGATAKWVTLDAERDGLVNVSRVYGIPLERPDRTVAWLKTTIHSEKAQEKHVELGWVREAFVYVNGQLVFADKNLYQPAAARKSPDGRLSLENGGLMLPLKAGDNEVAIAVVNNFYGWAVKMRFDDSQGLVAAR